MSVRTLYLYSQSETINGFFQYQRWEQYNFLQCPFQACYYRMVHDIISYFVVYVGDSNWLIFILYYIHTEIRLLVLCTYNIQQCQKETLSIQLLVFLVCQIFLGFQKCALHLLCLKTGFIKCTNSICSYSDRGQDNYFCMLFSKIYFLWGVSLGILLYRLNGPFSSILLLFVFIIVRANSFN